MKALNKMEPKGIGEIPWFCEIVPENSMAWIGTLA